MPQIKLVLSSSQQISKKAWVFSHERSGTHFLMNTLAANFGYIARPWFNFDYELGINFHAPAAIMKVFQPMHDKPVLNIVKSHHGYGFMAESIHYLLEQFHIFYIYRDPRDVMLSYW